MWFPIFKINKKQKKMRQIVINVEISKNWRFYCKASYTCKEEIMSKVLENEKDNQILSML